MPETSIRTLVEIQLDDKGSQDAQKAMKELVKQQQDLTAQWKNGDISAQAYNKELRSLVQQENELKTAIDNATGEFTRQEQAMKQAAIEARKLAQEQEQLSTAQGRFDKVAGGPVSLAGDAESSLRTIGGSFGALGGSAGATIEKGIGGVAEIGALVEALPKLKVAAQGTPAALSAAASALGPGGVLVVAVAAGAAALVALWKRSIKDMEERLKSFAQASANFVDFAAGGGTVEEAEKLNREAATRIELAQKEIVRLRERYAQEEFNVLDRVLNDGEQAIVDQIKDFEQQIRDAQADIDRRNEALKNDELPHEVKEATEAIQEQVTAQRELEKSMTATAQSAKRAATELSSQASSFQRRRADSARNRSAGTIGFGFLTGMTNHAEQQKEAEQLRDFNKELADIERDAQDKRIEQAIQAERALADVIRNFGDSRIDALEEQNFLSLDKLNTQEKRAKRDLTIDSQRANQDLARQTRQANDRLMQEARNYQNERLRLEQQAQQQSIQNMNQWATGFLGVITRFQSLAGGNRRSTFTAQPRTP